MNQKTIIGKIKNILLARKKLSRVGRKAVNINGEQINNNFEYVVTVKDIEYLFSSLLFKEKE